MSTGFKVTQIGNYNVDIDDLLMRREFIEFGNLWTWGYNTDGQLGDNSTINKSSPITVANSFGTWKSSSCGYSHNSAIKSDGTLWTWGSDSYGQLGDNSTVNKSSPITTSGGGIDWKITSNGYKFSAAIKTDGSLWTWGLNDLGQLGDNSLINKSSPVTISGGGTNWKTLKCGRSSSAAIKTDGTLWVWGSGANGQLGDNSTTAKSVPVTVSGGGTNWKQVACGYRSMSAIKTDGTLWTWGKGDKGQLGNNAILDTSSPVTTAGGGTNWLQTSVGGSEFCAAIKTNGTLWTWGNGQYGKLGDNTVTSKSSPSTVSGGGTTWRYVQAANTNTFALKTDGTLWAWGAAILGNNTATSLSSPVTIFGNAGAWNSISAYGSVLATIIN